jgi:autotransporter-associated beta strand protein
MPMKTLPKTIIAATVALTLLVPAMAMVFTTAAFTNVNQLSTNGTLIEASNLGTPTTSVVANGITFANNNGTYLNPDSGETSFTGASVYDSASFPITGLSTADADAMLDSTIYFSGTNNWNTILSGLTIGKNYEVQLILVDDRGGTGVFYIGDNNGAGGISPSFLPGWITLAYGPSVAPQLVTGTFTATATTQSFNIAETPGNNGFIMAYQLRDVTSSQDSRPMYWTGAASTAWNIADTNFKLTSDNTDTQFHTNDVVFFHDNPTNSTVDISGGNVSPLSVTFDNTIATNYSVQGSSGIASGSFTKSGNGSLTITNTNITGGPVELNGGLTTISNIGGLGSGAMSFDGGTLKYTGGTGSWTRNFTLNAGGGTLYVDATGTTLSTLGFFSNGGGLTKMGSGTLVLDSASNSHAGGTTVSAGTLKVSGTLGAGTGAVTVAGTGTLYLGGSSQAAGVVTLTGGSLASGVLNGSSYAVSSGSISSALTGNGVLTKSTAGVLTLTGASNHTGGTILNEGTIVVGAGSTVGTTLPAGYVIAAVGDSITEGGYHVSNPSFAWPGVLQSLIRARMGNSNVTVGNYGRSGATAIHEAGSFSGFTSPYMSGSNPLYAAALASKPNLVVIQLGTNDTIGTTEQIETYFTDNLTDLVNVFKSTENNPEIWLALPPKIYGSPYGNSETRLVNNVMPKILQVAAATGAKIIDNYTPLENESPLFADGLHPGNQGARLIGHSVYESMAATFFQNGPAGIGTLTLNGGTLSDDGFDRTLANPLEITGNLTFASTGGGSLTFDSSGLVTPSTVTLSNNPTITVHNTTTIKQVVSGTGFTKAGGGTLILSGINTYAGTTDVSAGTLVLTTASLADTADVRIGAPATLHLATTDTDTIGEFYIDGVAQVAGTWGGLTSGAAHTTPRIAGDGLLQVASGPDYTSWVGGFPGLEDTSKAGDPDGDGISNLMEYVLGGDPQISSSGVLPSASITDTGLILRYTRNDASVADTIQTGQWSTDLVHWSDVTPVVTHDNADAPDVMEIRIPPDFANGGSLFGRLKVMQSAP